MIAVESGIPMPSGKKQAKYPWRTMQVGDSFRHPGTTHAVYRNAYNAGRRYGRKFSCRKEPSGTRIWRIA